MKSKLMLVAAIVTVLLSLSVSIATAENIDYEYAFVRGNRDYQMYYVFDTDSKIVRYFSTNDYGVMAGTFTGNVQSGFYIHWMEGWDEVFYILEGGNAVLIDNDGFQHEYKASSVNAALAVLNQPGYHDMELE